VPCAHHKKIGAAIEKYQEDQSIRRPSSLLYEDTRMATDSLSHKRFISGTAHREITSRKPHIQSVSHAFQFPSGLQTHRIGKDIPSFHAIYSPAFLLALNLPLPRLILTHPHWAMNLRKMSKGTSGGAGPLLETTEFDPDATPLLPPSPRGFTDDGDYSIPTVFISYKKGNVDGLGSLTSPGRS